MKMRKDDKGRDAHGGCLKKERGKRERGDERRSGREKGNEN